MKTEVTFQHEGIDVRLSHLERRVKDVWKSDGRKVKDIKELVLYVKPEDGLVYYVINEIFTGSIPFEEQ